MPTKILKFTASLASKALLKNPLSILIYHRVLPDYDPMRPTEITAEAFEKQMSLLSRLFNVIPLSTAITQLQQNSLPPQAVCITFDDGYADNYTTALPILKKYDFNATFFIASGFLDGGCMWNDTIIETMRSAPTNQLELKKINFDNVSLTSINQRHNAAQQLISKLKYLPHSQRTDFVEQIVDAAKVSVPNNLMLSTEELRKLSDSGMTIGGHTVSHPILTSLTDGEVEKEIVDGKQRLEAIIGSPIKLFAYPNGMPGQDFNLNHSEIVKTAGFDAAVSTQWGVSTGKTNLYQLPRFTPWDRANWKFYLRLLHNSYSRRIYD